MFQIVRKNNRTQQPAPDRQTEVLRCAGPVRRSGLVWLIALVFSAVWLAVLAGVVIFVVLPELEYDIAPKTVAVCAAVLWLVLVLCVRSSIKRIRSVMQLICDGTALNVVLSDETRHRYLLHEITLRIHRVRNISQTGPVRNNHFHLYVHHGRKTDRYDVRVEDEAAFFAWLSQLPCQIVR